MVSPRVLTPRRRLAYVSVLVRDYDEAIDWYTGVLGWVLIEDSPRADGKRWVLIAPDENCETCLLLARAVTPDQRARIGDQSGGRVFLFMHTEDFADSHRELLERGVHVVEQARHEPYGTVAVFLDLYGNRWDLLQLHN